MEEPRRDCRRPTPVRRPTAILVLVLGTLVACGGDGASSPSATTTPDGGFRHATGAEDVVVEVSWIGGIAAPDEQFRDLPALVVTGDGTAIEQGPVPAVDPGPLLPDFRQRSISEEGIQRLLATADESGLLADVEYSRPDDVYDAQTAVVSITVDGVTYEHAAYALGLGAEDETDPGRVALSQFVEAAGDLEATVGADALGAQQPYVSDRYLVRAGEPTGEVAGRRVLEWPADAKPLAGAGQCASVPFDEVADLLGDADRNTLFSDGGEDYAVQATPRLPGRSC